MRTTSGARSRRRAVGVAVLAVAASVLTGCPGDVGSTSPSTTTTTIDPATNHAPTIASFTAVRPNGPAPLTTAFLWSINDVDGQSLTCSLDADGDGDTDRVVTGCTSSSIRSFTLPDVGTAAPTLVVSDGLAAATAQTTVVVTSAAVDSFSITLRLNGSMSTTQSAAFTDAAARWAQVIRTGLADASLNLVANSCGTGAPAFSGAIDDVLIDATIAPIDGVGAVLGQAGPCTVRTVGGLPMYGVMKFDSADVAQLESDGDFAAVILHEMGHVLGFGTIWSSRGLTGSGTSNPTFTGPTAVGGWQAIGGSGPVPVENSGGSGTANSHWRESVFNGELMTGYIDHNNNPLSAVTIGALGDLGYGVDLRVADAYGLPGLRRDPADSGESPGIELHTELIFPTSSA